MIEVLTVGPIGECCYFLPARTPGTCIVVDPGDEAEAILGHLKEGGLVPSLIALTHGHLDHTGAIPALLAGLEGQGPRPRIAIHAADGAYLGPGAEDANRRVFAAIRALGYFKHYWRPLPGADILLNDGDFLPDSDWQVIHSPGHTAGSACFYNAGLGCLISGDTLFRDGVGRTDGPDSDPEALARSIEGRLFALPPETLVYPGHGEATSLGRERGSFAP